MIQSADSGMRDERKCDKNGIHHRQLKQGLDVSALQKGIYLVKIITDTKTIVQKIIKQ
jgi:hypothetical protein